MLPELKAGDLIVGRAMGAYTWASASEFNFFPKATGGDGECQGGGHGECGSGMSGGPWTRRRCGCWG